MRIVVYDDMSLCTDAEVERMLPLVSPARREQALRYRHTLGRFCCLKSRLMLDEAMGGPERGEWAYNEYGKPYWPKGPYFSISHCRNGIAVVVADEEVGIDIESIRSADDSLIERTMNAHERALIRASGPRMFTRLWTQKEAVLKAIGTGIEGFEQLQTVLENTAYRVQTIEKENYIYSIAYGKLYCVGTQVPSADL